MAGRWSSEFIVAEHRDVQANAMAVDSTGNLALLAGRKCLALKNLNKLSEPLIKIPRQSKYDIGVAEWNPHSQHKELCAFTCDSKVEIVNVSSGCGGVASVTHVVGGHTRRVQGLSWHQRDPHIIATCSLDTYTHTWDLRDTRRPTHSFSSIVGARLVRWNRDWSQVLATAGSGEVRLWDERMGSSPVHYLSAHSANINCLEWNPSRGSQLATAGHDGQVKFFDLIGLCQEETVISCVAPVWKAKYTPFGRGLVVVLAPSGGRLTGGDNGLLLWSLSAPSTPVNTFLGHSDLVLDLAWRLIKPETANFQLITWSKDQTVRLWQVESFLETLWSVSAAAEETTTSVADESQGSQTVLSCEERSGEEGGEGRLGSGEPPPTHSFRQELLTLAANLPSLTIQPVEEGLNKWCMCVEVGEYEAQVQVTFPVDYPALEPPSFSFLRTNIDPLLQETLLTMLRQVALQRARRSKPCLEQCVKQLTAALEQIVLMEEKDKGGLLRAEASCLKVKLLDAFTPYPRMSGANFSNSGVLVCYGRKVVGVAEGKSSKAPAPPLSDSPHPPSSLHLHYRGSTGQARGRSLSRQKLPKVTVTLYDASPLFPVQKILAEKYVFEGGGVAGVCGRNAAVAVAVGRPDLAEAWTLAGLAAGVTPTTQDHLPWATHPLSLPMIKHMVEHYVALGDVQMAAMLCCVFGAKTVLPREGDGPTRPHNKSLSPELGGGRMGMTGMEGGGWRLHGHSKTLPRSNSWSDIFEESARIVEYSPLPPPTPPPSAHPPREAGIQLEQSELYDIYRLMYAELLEAWQLLHARAQVMKYMKKGEEGRGCWRGLEVVVKCLHCGHSSRRVSCDNCRRPTLLCSLCRSPVNGLANCCAWCHHGGHSHHLESWFSKHKHCPTGCGCSCLLPLAET